MPIAPLYPDQAEAALEVFRSLRIVDAAGEPTIGESCLPWMMDFASAIFGAYDAETGRRMIREFFLLVSKKNSKSTMAAAIMLTALIRNWRKSAEFLIVAPTLEVAQNSFKPAMDMVAADPLLSDLLKPNEHYRTIQHRTTGATLKVLAADKDTVTGKKAAGVLIDELWLFGKRADADSMLREVVGGLVSRPEGFVIYLSTQSDEPPSGTFRTKLNYFRQVRDGKIADPRSLPLIYEFPEQMVTSGAYQDPALTYVTNPNLGISVDREWLDDEYRKAEDAGEAELRVHCSKHLNIEIGLALFSDHWVGATYWESAADESITLDSIIDRCDVAVVGIDGGGLDDLFGLAVIGRDKLTRDWLVWSRAWAHTDVLERNKAVSAQLRDFATAGDLVICDRSTQDAAEAADIVKRLKDAGILPAKAGIGIDPVGVSVLIEELNARGLADSMVSVPQGYRLSGTIQGFERKLKDGTLWHSGAPLMAWCVGNAKVEQRGNAVLVTKQAAGTKAKIDPLVAAFDAFALMERNPEPLRQPAYQMMIFGGSHG